MLGRWFYSFRPWSADSLEAERIVKVTAHGLPIELWKKSNIKILANFWGHLQSMVSEIKDPTDVRKCSFFIKTNCVHRIDEVIKVDYGNRSVLVRISESDLGETWAEKEVEREEVSSLVFVTDRGSAERYGEAPVEVESEAEIGETVSSNSVTEMAGGNQWLSAEFSQEVGNCVNQEGVLIDAEATECSQGIEINLINEGILPLEEEDTETGLIKAIPIGVGPITREIEMNSRPILGSVVGGLPNEQSQFCSQQNLPRLDLEIIKRNNGGPCEKKNKKGGITKSLFEIQSKLWEDQVLEQLGSSKSKNKKGKKGKIKAQPVKGADTSKVVNASLSDGDFRMAAKRVWETGKAIGIRVEEDDDEVIARISEILRKEKAVSKD